jgi:ribosomal protein L34E
VSSQIAAHRPNKLRHLSKRQKSVNRIYGGHLSHAIVKER